MASPPPSRARSAARSSRATPTVGTPATPRSTPARDARSPSCDSALRLDDALAAVDRAAGWELPTDEQRPARQWVLARWTEVEIHRVDLFAGYGPDRWPPALVSRLLEREAPRVADRAREPLLIVTEPSQPGLARQEWRVGDGNTPTEVRGPDWAVLAWLVGRPSVAAHVLSAAPELGPYR